MTETSESGSEVEESFEEFDQSKVFSSGEKGMRPVSNHAMINFLRWVRQDHPEVRSLQQLSERQLFQLVEEFEGRSVQWTQWSAGFSLLLEGHSNKEGYESARMVFRQLGL